MKNEIKNILLEMISEIGINEASVAELCDTAEDFTWLFNCVKDNSEQFRTYFKMATYNTTGDYKTTFFINGLRAIITIWLDNDCVDPAEQMNEIAMREYRKLFN